MGNKDITQKRLEDWADVFSDIVNVLMFDGEEKIKPEALVSALPKSIYKADGTIHEQERDVAKYWTVNGVTFLLLGIENQTSADRYMPIRCFSYDGASYRNQLNKHDDDVRRSAHPDKLFPVITIVLYFGDKHWDQPRSLKEALDIPEGFEPFVNDYNIHVYEIQYLSDETVKKFRSDFKYVAQLFTQVRKKRTGEIKQISVPPQDPIHVLEVLDLMKAMTGDNRFEDLCNQYIKGGSVDMRTIFDERYDEGRRDALITLMCEEIHEGIRTKEQAAAKAGMTLPEFEAVLDEYRQKNQN